MGYGLRIRFGAVFVWTFFMLMSSTEVGAVNKDCFDFKTQPEAQRYFESNGGSKTNNVDFLDGDRNGIACESLPEVKQQVAMAPWLLPAAGAVVASAAVFEIVRRRRSSISPPHPALSAESSVSSDLGTQGRLPSAFHSPDPGIVSPVNVTINNVLESRSSTLAYSGSHGPKRFTPEQFKAMPYKEYLGTAYWRRVRQNAIARAGGKCSRCRLGNRVLDVHHLSYDFIGQEQDEFLVALCRECHRKAHDIPAPPTTSPNETNRQFHA